MLWLKVRQIMKRPTFPTILLAGLAMALVGSFAFNGYLMYQLHESQHHDAIHQTEMVILNERNQYYQLQLDRCNGQLDSLTDTINKVNAHPTAVTASNKK